MGGSRSPVKGSVATSPASASDGCVSKIQRSDWSPVSLYMHTIYVYIDLFIYVIIIVIIRMITNNNNNNDTNNYTSTYVCV